MPPSCAADDQTDMIPGDAVLSADFRVGDAPCGISCTHSAYLRFGDDCIPVTTAASQCAMPFLIADVLALSPPGEVRDVVVGRVAVEVSCNHSGRTRSDKNFKYESMNHVYDRARMQLDARVASYGMFGIASASQTSPCSRHFPVAAALPAGPDASIVADAIGSETGDGQCVQRGYSVDGCAGLVSPCAHRRSRIAEHRESLPFLGVTSRVLTTRRDISIVRNPERRCSLVDLQICGTLLVEVTAGQASTVEITAGTPEEQ